MSKPITTARIPKEIQTRLTAIDPQPLHEANVVDGEQEREVIREAVHEVKKDTVKQATPAVSLLSPDLVHFVRTGWIPEGSTAFCPIFESLSDTSASMLAKRAWSPLVSVTNDFRHVVINEKADNYLRPVNWILSSARDGSLVIISPYEANGLLPLIKKGKACHLHIYTPRVRRDMKPCDDLKFFCIPPISADWKASQEALDILNIFAGQLYFRDHAAYLRFCDLFDIDAKSSSSKSGLDSAQEADRQSLMPALRALVRMRRKGSPFAVTHVGRVLDGRMLTQDDF